MEPIPDAVNEVARQVVDGALTVHKALGPGLLESIYETCLVHELTKRGFRVQRQVIVPLHYDGIRLDAGLRLDLMVAEQVVVEIKAVEKLLPLFDAQLLTYLKLAQKRLGLLINFNTVRIKDGIRRIAL